MRPGVAANVLATSGLTVNGLAPAEVVARMICPDCCTQKGCCMRLLDSLKIVYLLRSDRVL